MKNIFKKAHKMTREMVKKYEVDYQAQFSLCLAYLLNNEEETEMKGTEKQIKFANDIKEAIMKILTELEEVAQTTNHEKGLNKIAEIKELINSKEDADKFIAEFKEIKGIYKGKEHLWFQDTDKDEYRVPRRVISTLDEQKYQ